MQSDRGFTLIELLVVIAIIGILAGLSTQSLKLYKSKAAYTVASSILRNARNALESSLTDQNNLPAAVALTVRDTQGAVDGTLLPGLYIQDNLKVQYAYDPSCIDASCPFEAYLRTDHCLGTQYTSWTRFGDGVEVLLENVDGADCN